MKKMLVMLLAAAMLLITAAAVAETPMVGGWTPAENPEITEERQAIFEKGTEKLLGVNYVPVAYLGSQVVAGINHAFLCQAVTVYPGASENPPAYKIVYLYENLSGEVSVLCVADFDIGSLCTY